MDNNPSGNEIDDNAEHPEKALFEIIVTEFGIVNVDSDVQL